MVKIHVEKIADIDLPSYGKIGDAGMDLQSREDITIDAGQTVLVPTGLKIEIPEGYVGLVHPRSGLSLKSSLRVANAPGTIDSGYRGEVCVIMTNIGSLPYSISKGDRIAQLVLQRFETIEWVEVDKVSESDRGEGGFGSTGK